MSDGRGYSIIGKGIWNQIVYIFGMGEGIWKLFQSLGQILPLHGPVSGQIPILEEYHFQSQIHSKNNTLWSKIKLQGIKFTPRVKYNSQGQNSWFIIV